MISGCEAKERYAHTSGEPVLLFSGGTEGEETVYALFLTQTAPSRVQADLREYAARTTQAQWTGALLEAAGEAPTPALPAGVLAGAGVGMLAVLIGLVVSLLCLRREKRRKVRQEQTDPKTGLGTAAALEESFSRVSRDQSRRFYSLVCLHLELDRVGQLWGYERAEELRRRGVLALQQSAEAGDLLARSGEELLILKRAPSPQEAAHWADGVVKALTEGKAQISVQVTGAEGLTDVCTYTVTKKEEEEQKGKTEKKGRGEKTSTDINLGYASYQGKKKNGKPHGNGTLMFKSRHLIPGTKDSYAEAGEQVIGAFRDGEINMGTLYQKNGNRVVVKHK